MYIYSKDLQNATLVHATINAELHGLWDLASRVFKDVI